MGFICKGNRSGQVDVGRYKRMTALAWPGPMHHFSLAGATHDLTLLASGALKKYASYQ